MFSQSDEPEDGRLPLRAAAREGSGKKAGAKHEVGAGKAGKGQSVRDGDGAEAPVVAGKLKRQRSAKAKEAAGEAEGDAEPGPTDDGQKTMQVCPFSGFGLAQLGSLAHYALLERGTVGE